MNVFSVIVLIMGGICLYAGLNHLLFFSRHSAQKENLFFALTCFTIFFYDLFCAGLYNAESVARGYLWQKGQFGILNFFAVCYMWFTYFTLKEVSRKFTVLFSLLFLLTLVLGLSLAGPLTLTPREESIKTVQLFQHTVTYFEARPGAVYIFQYFLMFTVYTFFFIAILRSKTSAPYKKPLLYSIACIYPGAINDICVGSGIYSFVYVLEYVYMLMILSMGYTLLIRFIHLHKEVEELNWNLETKVRERTEELKATRDALWGEMALARKIQTVLVPLQPELKDHKIAAVMRPIDQVGGDYYDVIKVRDRNWLIIGDVSGHGVPAGLIMMMVETAINSVLQRQPDLSPTKLLDIVNEVLIGNLKKIGEDRYMSITALAYQDKGVFRFSGMHQDILIYRKTGAHVEVVETGGIWLGVDSNLNPGRKDITISLNPGDVMLLYTDGIIEARAEDGSLFEQKRLADFLEKNGHRDAEEIKNALLTTLGNFRLRDDLTFMVIQKTETPALSV